MSKTIIYSSEIFGIKIEGAFVNLQIDGNDATECRPKHLEQLRDLISLYLADLESGKV